MKNFNLLVWLTQLGLSVALPLVGFLLLAVWLRNTLGLGQWIFWVGIILGLLCAAGGLRQSLQILSRLSDKKEEASPPVSFNDHD